MVNPTEEPYTLNIRGDWKGISGSDYEYYAPGSLTVANSMDNKNAVALKRFSPESSNNVVSLKVEPLSAGVLTITKSF